MMSGASLVSPIPLLALPQALVLVKRFAEERRYQSMARPFFHDAGAARLYTASESSLSLLVEHILSPLMLGQSTATRDLAEHLHLAVTALTNLIETSWSENAAMPVVSTQLMRQCLMPIDQAVLVVQVVLLTLFEAMLDDAQHLLVTATRSDGEVIVSVESDVAGLTAHGHPAAERIQVEMDLHGGSCEIRGEQPCYRVSLHFPIMPLASAV